MICYIFRSFRRRRSEQSPSCRISCHLFSPYETRCGFFRVQATVAQPFVEHDTKRYTLLAASTAALITYPSPNHLFIFFTYSSIHLFPLPLLIASTGQGSLQKSLVGTKQQNSPSIPPSPPRILPGSCGSNHELSRPCALDLFNLPRPHFPTHSHNSIGLGIVIGIGISTTTVLFGLADGHQPLYISLPLRWSDLLSAAD
jgi:hypothetical protein